MASGDDRHSDNSDFPPYPVTPFPFLIFLYLIFWETFVIPCAHYTSSSIFAFSQGGKKWAPTLGYRGWGRKPLRGAGLPPDL